MKYSGKRSVYYRTPPWFPFTLLSVGFLLTFITGIYIDRVADSKGTLLLERILLQSKESINRRLDTYIALLEGGAGLFAADSDVTLSEFKTYVGRLNLENNYKGIQGIGYSIRVKSEDLENLRNNLLQQGITNFTITPATPRDEYNLIIYLEPQNKRNEAAIGYDMFTDDVRRLAMANARDTARPSMSGNVILIQEIEKDVQSGFLIYYPLYNANKIPESIEDRRNLLKGYIYSPFRAGDFFSSIFSNDTSRDYDIYIYDGTKINEDSLLYKTNNKILSEKDIKKSVIAQMNDSGRTWSILILPKSQFYNSFERFILPYVLAVGFLISFILYILSQWQHIARVNAEKLAGDLLISQKALKQSESRLRRIVDANIIGVAFADKDGTITEANNALLQILGYSKNDILKRKVNVNKITPDEYKVLLRKTLKQIKKIGVHTPYEKEYIRADGTRVPVLVGKAYIKGNTEQIVVLVVDLTERKNFERQKDEFISIASHELKTPVTSLKAYSHVLNKYFKKQNDETAISQFKKMDNQIDKLITLIQELLDVSKIEAGKLVYANEPFDMNSLVKEAVEEIQHITKQHKIIIKGKTRSPVLGDKTRINQVITNLLSNAIKYSPDANKIEVNLKDDNNFVYVCVKDYGLGIEKKAQKKLFERFYRVNNPDARSFPGLGLGLYIIAQIIKQQKGKIWVESDLGKGSEFCFRLPLYK